MARRMRRWRSILAAPDKIEHLAGGRIIENAVYREIAALRVGDGIGIAHRCGMTAVAVVAIRTEGGHLECKTVLLDHDHAEGAPHGIRLAREERLDLFRTGGGGDVNILERTR